jgi:hypothetical protein
MSIPRRWLAPLAGLLLCSAAAVCSAQRVCPQPTFCGQAPPAARQLPALQRAAGRVQQVLCSDGATADAVTDAFVRFVQENRDWFAPYGGFAREAGPLGRVADVIELGSLGDLPTITSSGEFLQVGQVFFFPEDATRCDAQAGADATCADVFDEFEALYNHAHRAYAFCPRARVVQELEALGSAWDAYLDRTRSFTSLEMLANSLVYRNNESVSFTTPPSQQIVLLHPSLAVENVCEALDGEDVSEALIIDVAGISFWRQDRWWLPTGGALSTAYADRAGIPDWGYGVSLYFGDKYTVGWTNHGGANGVFVSIDFLQLLQSKKKVAQRIQRELESAARE